MIDRDLLFAGRRLRAGLRILLFLGLVALCVSLAYGLVASLIPADASSGLRLGVYQSTLAASGLIVSWIFMARVDRRPFAMLGLHLGAGVAEELGRGALVGAACIAALVGVEALLGWLHPVAMAGGPAAWGRTAIEVAVLMAIAAVAEEVVFRGYAFQLLVASLGAGPAVVIASVAFGAIHAGNPGVRPLALVNVALAGALLAAACLRTRSLWVAIGLHWAWNWTMAAVFDLPVSGIVFDMPGYDLRQSGPSLLTGGGFGPEGGLLTAGLLLLVTVWAFRTRWLHRSPAMRRIGTLMDARLDGVDRPGRAED